MINPDGTTTELSTEGPIKDLLKTDESYVIVADEIRKVFLWKGIESSVRSKFIGAKRSQEIRGQVGMHYGVVPIDEGDETEDFLKIIGGKTEAGIAHEIKEEKATYSPAPAAGGNRQSQTLRQKPAYKTPRPAKGMNIAGSKSQTQNTGPLYTGQASMDAIQGYPHEDKQIDFDQIMKKLEEIKIPDGYERELIIIGNHAYAVVEKVSTFLGKKQVEKIIEEVGSIPEGVFFAEGYSPRVLSENGKIIAVEFLKGSKKGESGPAIASEYKDKKHFLKEQIKMQLGEFK
ncbi:MAG: hypothetical protein ACFFAN_18800 [Promethearchaeota archaeon]